MKIDNNEEPTFTGGARTINTTNVDQTKSDESIERNKLDKTVDISIKTANTSCEITK